MRVEIAPMGLDDLNEVLEIEKNSFSFPWSRNSFYLEIAGNKYAHYMVARLKESGRVIGYGGLWIVFDEAHITTLAVHADYQGTGVGSFILAHLIKKAMLQGAVRVFLEVRDSNKRARHLYGKFNFAVVGRRKNYYLDEDAIIMVKDLGNDRPENKGSVLKCHEKH